MYYLIHTSRCCHEPVIKTGSKIVTAIIESPMEGETDDDEEGIEE